MQLQQILTYIGAGFIGMVALFVYNLLKPSSNSSDVNTKDQTQLINDEAHMITDDATLDALAKQRQAIIDETNKEEKESTSEEDIEDTINKH